jgi:hypothetical protein
MEEKWTEEELMLAVELTVERAKADEELAKLILEDPKAAISHVTGKECPPGASIEFINLGIGIRVSFPGMRPEEPGEGQPGQVSTRLFSSWDPCKKTILGQCTKLSYPTGVQPGD